MRGRDAPIFWEGKGEGEVVGIKVGGIGEVNGRGRSIRRTGVAG